MNEKAKVFERTYRSYLEQVAKVDLAGRADRLGARMDGGELIIPFYGKNYRVSAGGVLDSMGKPADFAVSVVACKYVLMCPETATAAGDWMTYRDFKDSGPLVNYFANNTHRIIAETFSGKLDALRAVCMKIGGRPASEAAGFDLSIQFDALPRIPLFLRFNDRDDEFPAQCTVLFRRSAEHYLDMECLAILGTFLTGRLLKG